MAIIYTDSLNGVRPDHLSGFFVGWPNPPAPETHLRLLHGSDYVWLARQAETGQVIGFINALSDGVLSASIPLLEVLPGSQGQGVGSELVRRMLASLSHLYAVDLMCDAELQRFYARLDGLPATGIIWRNYVHQNGT
jgi:ribosomal protein S18 acetylase RimI-like enzyme